MLSPEKMFNPQELIQSLSRAVTGSDYDIELDEFHSRKVKQRPLRAATEQYRARAPIMQTVHSGLLAGIAGLDGETNVGYVELRSGQIEFGREENPFYEELVLRITKPLILRNEKVIPNCRIRVYKKSAESGEISVKRSDRLRSIWPFWRKTDLSAVLPTEWF